MLVPVILFGERYTTLDEPRLPLSYDTSTGQIIAEGTSFVARHFDVFRGSNTGRLLSWQPPNFVDLHTAQVVATVSDLLGSTPSPSPSPTPGTTPSGPTGTQQVICPQGSMNLFGTCVRTSDLLLGLGVVLILAVAQRR